VARITSSSGIFFDLAITNCVPTKIRMVGTSTLTFRPRTTTNPVTAPAAAVTPSTKALTQGSYLCLYFLRLATLTERERSLSV
jgi:hypothetical protein